MEGGLGPWIPQGKIHVDICAGIKMTRRKVANTKKSVKATVHSQGGRGGGLGEVEPALGYFRTGYLLCLSELGGALAYSGVVSNGACFQSFGGLHPQIERGSF